MTLLPGQVRIYQCKWAACDAQYESETGLLEHVIQHHTSQIISKSTPLSVRAIAKVDQIVVDSDQQYVCMWMTCLRNRKDGKPFPSLPRLHRHIKEKHMPNSAKNIYATQLGKNFYKVVHNHGDPPTTQMISAPYGRVPAPSNGPQLHQSQANGVNGHVQPQAHGNGQPAGQHIHAHPQNQQPHHGEQNQQQVHYQVRNL